MFRLLRYFSVASLLAIAAVTVLLALFYRYTAIAAMIEQEEGKNVALTQTFANFVRQELAGHLARSAGVPAGELEGLPSLAGLRRTIAATGYLLKSLEAQQFIELLAGLERGEAPMTRDLAARILR